MVDKVGLFFQLFARGEDDLIDGCSAVVLRFPVGVVLDCQVRELGAAASTAPKGLARTVRIVGICLRRGGGGPAAGMASDVGKWVIAQGRSTVRKQQ